MIHGRPDHNRIQDPAGIIPDNEPVFLLRGQDVLAPAVIEYWAAAAGHRGASRKIVDAALEQAQAMRRYQKAFVSKLPDMP